MRVRSFFKPEVFARDRSALGLPLSKLAPDSDLTVNPSLTPRDEAIFWLTAAAEVEHFLMVHYLFAAYSVDPGRAGANRGKAMNLRDSLLQIAREEMGHLITVQNLLTLVGAPLHFGREHSPYASEIYPFRFKLERVSKGSLAKYAMAESPVDRAELEKGLSSEDLKLFDTEIKEAALASNDCRPVQHVGPIFARLYTLFKNELADGDFRLDRASRQARWSDWGYRRHPGDSMPTELRVLVHRFDQTDAANARIAAHEAIEDIGEQGENADEGIGDGESHFERFLLAYKDLVAIETSGSSPVLPVVANPNVTLGSTAPPNPGMVEAVQEALLDEGRISEPRSRAWAQLFNLRYRLLLRFLNHALLLSGSVFVDKDPGLGDRTTKGLLVYWTFKEMRRLAKIARKLVRMPSGQSGLAQSAGPPFELPYTLALPADDVDRWAGHADVLRASQTLTAEILVDARDQNDPFLTYLQGDDVTALAIADALASGLQLPDDANPSAFQKVAAILDEAVRGFPIGSHGAFWQNMTRDMFVTKDVYGSPPIMGKDVSDSMLYDRINRSEDDGLRMPRFRPRIDQTRIDFIRAWIEAGAPDNDPAEQIGLLPEPEPNEEPSPPMPEIDVEPGFESSIKPLFRENPDRTSMRFLFDLHDYNDVKENAHEILASLESGRMPCTMAWPEDRISLFRAWIAADFPA